MFTTCPFCGGPILHHCACCRVPADLDRFERVYDRLAVTHTFARLEDRLAYYLHAFGRRDAPPAESQPLRGGENSATTGA